MKMRLRSNIDVIILIIIGTAAAWWAASDMIKGVNEYRQFSERDACEDAYKRELARLKTWREEQLAMVAALPEAKRLEAQLVIDYTLQIAAGKLQGSIMSRSGEECRTFRMKDWPEGIEKIVSQWIFNSVLPQMRSITFDLAAMRSDGSYLFVINNLTRNNAAQADDAAVRIR